MARLSRTIKEVTGRAHEGLDALERKAVEVGRNAEGKLGERGLSPQQLTETIAAGLGAAGQDLAKQTRRSRKRLAKNARRTRKELIRAARDAKQDARQAAKAARRSGRKTAVDIATELEQRAARARKEAAIASRDAGRRLTGLDRRRWPWLVVGGIAVAAAVTAAVYFVRSRSGPAASAEVPDAAPSTTSDGAGQATARPERESEEHSNPPANPG